MSRSGGEGASPRPHLARRGPMPIMIWVAIILEGALEDWPSFGVLLAMQFLNSGAVPAPLLDRRKAARERVVVCRRKAVYS